MQLTDLYALIWKDIQIILSKKGKLYNIMNSIHTHIYSMYRIHTICTILCKCAYTCIFTHTYIRKHKKSRGVLKKLLTIKSENEIQELNLYTDTVLTLSYNDHLLLFLYFKTTFSQNLHW